MDKRIVITALVSAIGGGVVGGAVTYLTVKKTFAERAQRDIDDVKQAYKDKYDGKMVVNDYTQTINMPPKPTQVPKLSPEQQAEAEQFVRDLGYAVPSANEDEPVRRVSIYESEMEPPAGVEEITDIRMRDYDMKSRVDNHKPYIISVQEYMNGGHDDWDKLSLTYYEDDDIVTDESDRPIDNVEYLIDSDHLSLFGVMSDDSNIVYVRNGQISADFEIVRNIGSYTEIVHGIPKGSAQVGTKMYRGDDE